MRNALLFLGLMLSAAGAGAMAQAGGFTLANQTGQPLTNIAARDVSGGGWLPLAGSLGPGARQPINFANEDCAFDIRANLPGGQTVTWTGVNLCDVRVVSLSRRADGTIWVDYD